MICPEMYIPSLIAVAGIVFYRSGYIQRQQADKEEIT